MLATLEVLGAGRPRSWAGARLAVARGCGSASAQDQVRLLSRSDRRLRRSTWSRLRARSMIALPTGRGRVVRASPAPNATGSCSGPPKLGSALMWTSRSGKAGAASQLRSQDRAPKPGLRSSASRIVAATEPRPVRGRSRPKRASTAFPQDLIPQGDTCSATAKRARPATRSAGASTRSQARKAGSATILPSAQIGDAGAERDQGALAVRASRSRAGRRRRNSRPRRPCRAARRPASSQGRPIRSA